MYGEQFSPEVIQMTETPMNEPGDREPLILERLSDLEDQAEYLAHYPDVRGRAVLNPTGEEVGIVEELYVNPRDHQVEMAAITFTGAAGYHGKRVLVPVEELQFLDDSVRILVHEERMRLAPEFHEGAPMYEPYYEYWSKRAVGPPEERSAHFVHTSGRLELEGEDEEAIAELEKESETEYR